MKKIRIIAVVLLLASGFAFAQTQPAGFSNTLYTGLGSGSIREGGVSAGDTDFKFEGLVDNFTANLTTKYVNVSGDITWQAFEDFKFSAKILGHNFNGTINPFEGFSIGFGTNLNWQIGPKPFSGPLYTSYETPYFAGLKDVDGQDRSVKNYFAQESIAIRYAYEDYFAIGLGLNSDLSGGIGIYGNIMDVVTLGFAYNGKFEKYGNNFYFGSQILLDPLDIDIWVNVAQKYNTTVGARFEFYSPTKTFFFAPEFSLSFFEQDNRGMSMYVAFLGEMSITNNVLLGLNASWGFGSDINTEFDFSKSGNRLNITPHLVWNINKMHRLSFGVNLMPVWWQNETSDFFWNIPISWTVYF